VAAAVSKLVPKEAARAVNAQHTKSLKSVRASNFAEHVKRGWTVHILKGYRASHEREQGEATSVRMMPNVSEVVILESKVSD
jgi:hypothetical protein